MSDKKQDYCYSESRITRIETLVGDADSGLRGDIKKMDQQVQKLFSLFRSLEKRILLAMGGGAVVLWLLNTLASPLLQKLVTK